MTVDTLLSIGLWNAAGATALALAAAAAGLVCRRPAFLHALWLLVLLKLLTPPLWQIPVNWPEPEQVVQAPLPAPMQPPADVPELPVLLHVGTRAPEVDVVEFSPPETPEPIPWANAALTAWAAGSAFWFGLTLTRVLRFRRVLRRLAPAPAELQKRVADIAGRLGLRRVPTAYLVAAPVSPLVWALGRARLVLPAGLWQRLGEDQRDLLLAHELAHLRRGDGWVRLVEIFALGLYWWHPVAWWARRRLEETGEECCDAWVVSAFPALATDYAHALVESAAYLSAARAAVPVGASGMGRVPLLRRRLTMILQGRTPRALSRGGVLMVVAVAAGLLPLWPVRAQPARDDGGPQAAVPGPNDPQPDPKQVPPPGDKSKQLEQLRAEVQVASAHLEVAKTKLLLALRGYDDAKADLDAAKRDGKKDLAELRISVVYKAVAVADCEQQVATSQAALDLANKRLREAQGKAKAPEDKSAAPGEDERPFFDLAQLFDNTVWNFGKVARGMPVAHSFVFMNTAKRTVKIGVVRPSSTAVKADVSKTEIRPGESATIEVTLDTGRFTGPKTFYLMVSFSQPAELEVKLEIKGVSWEPSSPPNKAGDADRLRELEEKLEKLQQDLDSMRKELDRGKTKLPRPKAQNSVPMTFTNSNRFKVPFNIDPSHSAQIGQLVLLVSDDEGETWSLAAKARPEAGAFEFTAPRDGVYWFVVETEDRNGVREPASKGDWQPQLTVAVKTAP
jgi:beta-lactamase regulating signal transducer with metallopeptidase domain